MLNLRFHSFLIFLIPVIAIHVSFFLSTSIGTLDLCNPYIDGCLSISRSSRQPISILFFKVLMIVSGILLFFIWPRILKKSDNSTFKFIGQIGSIFLIIYVIALGNDGDVSRFMRQYGVFIFYLSTLSSQWYYSFYMKINSLKLISYWQIVATIASIPFYIYLKNDSAFENIFEWWLSLSINVWFLMYFIYLSNHEELQ